MNALRQILNRVSELISRQKKAPVAFPGSERYWEERYSSGGNSGVGSYDKFATFKAEVINAFVEENRIASVIEFGCGDGNQLSLANYPAYTGFDVSETIISQCREKFILDKSKLFKLTEEYNEDKADLSLSLDVIYHLVEDEVFEIYMRNLFDSSLRFVIIYSSNYDSDQGYRGTHVRHRKFTRWIEENLPTWNLIEHIPNKYPYQGNYKKGSFADFYFYQSGSP